MLEKEKQVEELVAKQASLEQANVELQGKVTELEVKQWGWEEVGWLVQHVCQSCADLVSTEKQC